MANQHVKLKDGSNYLFPEAVLNGIDFSNLIAQWGNVGGNQTATQDGYCVIQCGESSNVYGYIDDVECFFLNTGNHAQRIIIFVKKGQTFRVSTSSNIYMFYGIKR